MRRSIMIVIPEVLAEPKFDLGDPPRALSLAELAEIADYEAKLSNYTDISTVLDKWPVNGDWDQVIDDKGPIHIKNGQRYHIYSLDANRIEEQNVGTFVSGEVTDFGTSAANIALGHITEVTIDEWLGANEYEKVLAAEI